jgi:hypothetical protein
MRSSNVLCYDCKIVSQPLDLVPLFELDGGLGKNSGLENKNLRYRLTLKCT